MVNSLKNEVFDWLEKNKWSGFDPFDGLTSPLQKFLVNRWLQIAFLQLIKRSPFNLRPLFCIQPQENAMSWSAGILGALEASRRGEMKKFPFIKNGVERIFYLQTEDTKLWGYPFPWASKAFYLKEGEPNLVLSALALRTLAKTMLAFPKEIPPTWHKQYQQAAEAIFVNFYKKDLGYFSYISNDNCLVHNANLFGAESLAWALPLGVNLNSEKLQSIKRALQITLAAQEDSGRWSYGTRSHHQWCDNFHTAYNLISLSNIHSILPDDQITKAIQKGLHYYLQLAFTENGKPRYYDQNHYPLETHGSAVGLILLREMVQGNWLKKEQALVLAKKIASNLKKDFYLGNGKFIYRKGRFCKNRTVFTRWTQAWVYYGLEALLSLEASS